MANILTVSRIVMALLLLFLPVASTGFYALYLLAGATDMLDGRVARKTGTVSEAGAKLDTAADLVFTAVCLIKLLPCLDMPAYLWVWTALIAVIKIINIIYGLAAQRKFAAVHSSLNKLTGFLLFILPLTLSFVNIKYSAGLVCVAATIAAVQENHFIKNK